MDAGRFAPDGGPWRERAVLAGASRDDEFPRREVFGQVVEAIGFTSTDQAVAWAGDPSMPADEPPHAGMKRSGRGMVVSAHSPEDSAVAAHPMVEF